MTSPRPIFCVVISVLLSCYGCAPGPSKPSGESSASAVDLRSTGEPRRVVVISAGKAPVIDFQQGPRAQAATSARQSTAAGEGAAAGATFGLQLAIRTFGLGIVLLPATTVAGALIGHGTTGRTDAAALRKEMSKAAALRKDLDQRLVGEIATSLRGAGIDEVVIERAASVGWKTAYPSPVPQERRHSADATLHVTLLRVGFETTPHPEYLAVVVAVKASMISAGAAGGSLTRTYIYRSADLQAGRWTANDSVAFKHALGNAFSLLADQVTEDLLMDSSAQRAPNQDGTCGLPPTDSTRSASNYRNRIAVLQTRQPTLTWAAFDAAAIRGAGSAGATDPNAPEVAYDVRIWRSEGGYTNPGLIYSRSGLVRPEHKVEVPLELGVTYAWSVRARVLANNRSKVVTPWTSIVGPGDEEEKTRSRGLVSTKIMQSSCLRSLIIVDRYMRFQTSSDNERAI